MSEKRAMRLKVQELHGRLEGKDGRDKWARIASYPGRLRQHCRSKTCCDASAGAEELLWREGRNSSVPIRGTETSGMKREETEAGGHAHEPVREQATDAPSA